MRPAEHIVWRGGEHPFRLGIGELRAIEKRCDAGCFVILTRLLSSQCYIDDVVSPIRLGLVGAGMSEKDAQALMDKVQDEANPYTLTVTAADIMRRFLMWDDEEDKPPLGEAVAGKAAA